MNYTLITGATETNFFEVANIYDISNSQLKKSNRLSSKEVAEIGVNE